MPTRHTRVNFCFAAAVCAADGLCLLSLMVAVEGENILVKKIQGVLGGGVLAARGDRFAP